MALEQSVQLSFNGSIYEVKPHVKAEIEQLLRPYRNSARNALTRNDLQKVAPAIFDRMVDRETKLVNIDSGSLEPDRPEAEETPDGKNDPSADAATDEVPTTISGEGEGEDGPDPNSASPEPEPGGESGDDKELRPGSEEEPG